MWPEELSHWEGFASRRLANTILALGHPEHCAGGVRLKARGPQQAQSGLETRDSAPSPRTPSGHSLPVTESHIQTGNQRQRHEIGVNWQGYGGVTQRESSQRGGVAATRKECSLTVRWTWRCDAAHTQLWSSAEAVGQFEGRVTQESVQAIVARMTWGLQTWQRTKDQQNCSESFYTVSLTLHS